MSDKIFNVKITNTETNQEICNANTSIIFMVADSDKDDDTVTVLTGARCSTAHVGDTIIAALDGLRRTAIQSSAGEWLFVASLREFLNRVQEETKNAD